MAKSLRSKSRRRNMRVKREKQHAKQIEQLKKTLGLTREAQKLKREAILKDVSDIAAGIEASKKNPISAIANLAAAKSRYSPKYTPVQEIEDDSNSAIDKDENRVKQNSEYLNSTNDKEGLKKAKKKNSEPIDVDMEEDSVEFTSKYVNSPEDKPTSKKLKDKDGKQPVWKSQRKIKAAKKNAQKAKKQIGKKNKKNTGKKN